MNKKLTKSKILFVIFNFILFTILIYKLQLFGFHIFCSINIIAYILNSYITWKKAGVVDYLNFRLGYYAPMVIIPTIALTGFFLIMQYYKPTETISKSDIISFYGSFLSFVGAFCLGYFIYKKGESNRTDDKIAKCKLLLNCLDSTDMDMLRVARYGYKPAFIVYDANWINYFYEYESLIHSSNNELKSTLKEHFNTIDKMNIAITQGDYEAASNIYEQSIIDDCYSISKYNQTEAKLCISDACAFKQYGFNVFKFCWLEQPEIIKLIEEYRDAYFPIIETYVWNYMIKNNIACTCDQQLEREITDWLLQNETFKQIAKSPPDKRIVTKIVFECFLMINKKSNRLSFVWNEFSIKK